ncbi:MAG: hypothetical protein PVI00_14035 [Desulfobacterales bacterium]|jgi:phosphoribosylanthranilate isomerase
MNNVKIKICGITNIEDASLAVELGANALGFGIKKKSDIDFLKGKADIAVIGSQMLRVVEQKGVAAVGDFICSLR